MKSIPKEYNITILDQVTPNIRSTKVTLSGPTIPDLGTETEMPPKAMVPWQRDMNPNMKVFVEDIGHKQVLGNQFILCEVKVIHPDITIQTEVMELETHHGTTNYVKTMIPLHRKLKVSHFILNVMVIAIMVLMTLILIRL